MELIQRYGLKKMITLIVSCSMTRIQVKGENKETKIKIENALKADSTEIKTNTNF